MVHQLKKLHPYAYTPWVRVRVKLAFCTFDQLEEFIKSCQNHNEEEEEEEEEEYQEEVLPFGESYWDYLPDLVKEYILEMSEVAIQEELQARYEHKIKMEKVFRHIKHPNKRRYRFDHDYGYSRTYLDSDDEHDSDLDSIYYTDEEYSDRDPSHKSHYTDEEYSEYYHSS